MSPLKITGVTADCVLPKLNPSFDAKSLASISPNPTELISGCVNVAAGILL